MGKVWAVESGDHQRHWIVTFKMPTNVGLSEDDRTRKGSQVHTEMNKAIDNMTARRAGLILISGFSPCTSYGRSGSWVVLLVGTAVVRTDLDDRCLSSGPSRCSQLCVLSGRCTYHLEWKRSLAVRVPKWKHQLAPIVEHRQFEDLEGPTTTTGSDFYKGDNVCQLWQS